MGLIPLQDKLTSIDSNFTLVDWPCMTNMSLTSASSTHEPKTAAFGTDLRDWDTLQAPPGLRASQFETVTTSELVDDILNPATA